MDGIRENYYVLLDLAFDPPVTDDTAIKAAVQKKKQEWIRLQDTPGRRSVALHNLGQIAEIERVMHSPALRAEEAVGAIELRADMLRQFEAELRILESKRHITPREAASLAVKYSSYGIRRDDLDNLARVPVSETPPAEDEEQGETMDRLTAKTVRRNLSVLGLGDLYAFLDLPAYSSIKKLCDAAEEKRRGATQSGTKTAYVNAVQELSGICLQLFASFDAKQRYDRYLKISAYPAVGDLIDDQHNRDKFISPDVMLRIVNFAVEKYACRVLEAEEYIRRYCKAYDIPINTQSRMIECPNCQNKTDRDAAVCTVCAAPLKGECPGCATAFEGGVNACPQCGFSIAEMGKARAYMDDAETALIESNWSLAQRCISYARRYWPGHPALDSLLRRAKLLEDRYSSYVDNIADAVDHCQYYAALEMIEEAENRRIRLPASVTGHVRKIIGDFEVKLEEVRASGAGAADYSTLYSMMADISDSIELSRLLAGYPPEPVEDLSGRVFGRRVRLDWTKSPAGGVISYTLVRKADNRPLTAYDGEILYEGMANSFEDKTAPPLQRFYYAVYVKRGNAYSEEGAVSASILIIPEVENLRMVPIDAGARISWDFSPDLREVQIWRKLGGERPMTKGDGILLENSRLDGISDSKLKNDVEYWYYIVAVYIVDGLRVFSKGVCDSVVPHKLLAPIDQLDIMRVEDQEDVYVVNWHTGQYADVLLLASQKKPEFQIGETVPVAELMEDFRNLDMEAKTATSARVRCQFSGGLYVFAAAVSGKYATIGGSKYIINVPDVQDISRDVLGSDVVFNMKWPGGVDEVLAAWRFDAFPKSPDEPGAAFMSCTPEQYGYDAGMVLREPEQNLYYMKFFAVFTSPDGEKFYSPGVEVKVDLTPMQEILYDLRYTKSFFAAAYTVTLSIRSEDEFILPKAVIVGKIGRLPLRKTDGMPLFEIEKETRVGASITYEYRTSLLPKDLYVKMFLRDDALYGKYRLLPVSDLRLT
ncbi:MAG: hypothetical protein FWH02_00380 [Oscillospiraceae bacterium]|nr:hypothetical protein [Oscillospiraceae bacterium]